MECGQLDYSLIHRLCSLKTFLIFSAVHANADDGTTLTPQLRLPKLYFQYIIFWVMVAT